LSWTSEGTSGCELSGTAIAVPQSHPASASTTMQLTQDATFELTCFLGEVEDVVTKTVELMPANSAP